MCAQVAGIDWENGPGKCAGLDGSGKGAEGVALLQKSVRATAALGITCVVIKLSDRGWCRLGRLVRAAPF